MEIQAPAPIGQVDRRQPATAAPTQNLDLAHSLTEYVMEKVSPMISPDQGARVVSLSIAFESPRSTTGGANPYFLSTHHFYEGLTQIPEIAENIEARKDVIRCFFDYGIDSLVQGGSMTRERGEQLKEENRQLLANVNDWGEFIAYTDWANRVFSRYGSSMVFSGPSQALMLALMTQTSGTVQSETGRIGQELMRRRISEAVEQEDEEEAKREAEGHELGREEEREGFFTPGRRRK